MEISSSCRLGKHFYSGKMAGEGSRSISTAKKRSARGRGAFPQRKNGLRGVAEHFHNEKMACGGSPSISTAKKWPAGDRGAFLQRKNGLRGVAEHSYSEKTAGEGSPSILTAKRLVFARLIVPFACASSI